MLGRPSRVDLEGRIEDLREEVEAERDTARALAAELDMARWALRELRTFAQDHRDDPVRIAGWTLGITERWAMPHAPSREVAPPKEPWRGHSFP